MGIKNIKKYNQKMTIISQLLHIFLIVLLLITALAAYVMRVFDPLHYGIVFFVLYAVYGQAKKIIYQHIQKRAINRTTIAVSRFTRTHRVVIGALMMFLFVGYVLVSIIPTGRDVFSLLSETQQTEIVTQDIEEAAVLLDMLMLSGDKLLANPSLIKNELSQEEGLQLKYDWENFILTSIQTEEMTDRHRYFHQISMFSNKETHVQSFVIAYALYVKKFEIFHKVITRVSKNNAAIKIFNQHSDRLGVEDMYSDVAGRFFASNSFLRRNLGYLYYRIRAPEDVRVVSPNYASLLEVSRSSYQYIAKNILSHVTERSTVYKGTLDRAAFEAWLPIQKNLITDKVGNIHVGDRKDKFITVEQIQEMKTAMQPGDILVYRKNWYASNLGIPGFWTHAGIYTGTLEEMEVFFKDEFPHKGYSSLNLLLQNEHPKVFQVMRENDIKNYTPSVVESQTHGTLIQSVESSAAVDYVGVVRTKLTKAEILEAVLTSYGHYGKKYDYAFDLDTKDEIYCSELVYDAYLKTSKTRGITFPKPIVSGRPMVPPHVIVEKFATEKGTEDEELSFVYFLDASEETKKAFMGTEVSFMETSKRPKYSVIQE